MGSKPQRLPYGLSDFTVLQGKDLAYLDRTDYLPVLEQAGEFLFFLRPRRFGKSLSLSMVQCYYDINFANDFEDLFSSTWIGQNATGEKNSYLVLPFDFSQVSAEPGKVEESFEWHVRVCVNEFTKRYERLLDHEISETILAAPSGAGALDALFQYASRKQLKLYVLIDEYDNFTNTILSVPEKGPDIYRQLTHADGFFRDFFKVLKGGTAGTDSALGRLLVTGVSPVTMDDVTSGFNIGLPLSLEAPFSGFVGFSRLEVSQLIDRQEACEILSMEKDDLLELMASWYGGYRFNEDDTQALFNPDMVLFFLRSVRANKKMPHDMVDHNIWGDFMLRHLVITERHLNENFRRLKAIIDDGFCHSRLVTGLPADKLTYEQNFISLLYYLGLLTIRGMERGLMRLEIPNKAIETLLNRFMDKETEEVGKLTAMESF